MSIKNITVIGVGLIGGSFAKGLKSHGFKGRILGYGSNPEKLKRAVSLKVVDDFTLDIKTAVENADLIMVSVPMGAFLSIFNQIKPHLKPHTIITDAGSSKVSVIQSAEAVFGNQFPLFIPAHPIAGKEQSGVEAADENLYEQHKVILTPTHYTDKTALNQVKQLWTSLGANLFEMSAEKHDDVLAASSHLPHLLAFAIVDLLADNKELPEVFEFTAGGFKDFSRIASSDPTMWRDITQNNSTAIVKWLKNYQTELNKIIDLVENNQQQALFQLFSDAKKTRDECMLDKRRE